MKIFFKDIRLKKRTNPRNRGKMVTLPQTPRFFPTPTSPEAPRPFLAPLGAGWLATWGGGCNLGMHPPPTLCPAGMGGSLGPPPPCAASWPAASQLLAWLVAVAAAPIATPVGMLGVY